MDPGAVFVFVVLGAAVAKRRLGGVVGSAAAERVQNQIVQVQRGASVEDLRVELARAQRELPMLAPAEQTRLMKGLSGHGGALPRGRKDQYVLVYVYDAAGRTVANSRNYIDGQDEAARGQLVADVAAGHRVGGSARLHSYPDGGTYEYSLRSGSVVQDRDTGRKWSIHGREK